MRHIKNTLALGCGLAFAMPAACEAFDRAALDAFFDTARPSEVSSAYAALKVEKPYVRTDNYNAKLCPKDLFDEKAFGLRYVYYHSGNNRAYLGMNEKTVGDEKNFTIKLPQPPQPANSESPKEPEPLKGPENPVNRAKGLDPNGNREKSPDPNMELELLKWSDENSVTVSFIDPDYMKTITYAIRLNKVYEKGGKKPCIDIDISRTVKKDHDSFGDYLPR